jgi:hypothetical protein
VPIIDFSSRWNSTYDMLLARAIEIILATIWNIDCSWMALKTNFVTISKSKNVKKENPIGMEMSLLLSVLRLAYLHSGIHFLWHMVFVEFECMLKHDHYLFFKSY